MPTITFSLKDLGKLIGKRVSAEELNELLAYCKGEVSGVNGDEISAEFSDTNLPYLWSAEGVARALKGVLGIEKGLAKINTEKSSLKIIVDGSVKSVRPYIGGFLAKGVKVNDYLIKQIIQLQEKFCDSYGRKRKKVAIGVYKGGSLRFPIHYKAVEPESIEFAPLGFKKKMSLGEILESHPTGQEYKHLVDGFKKYPILIDDSRNVLSFPPIINSEVTGKVEESDDCLFVEATGDDFNAVMLAVNIFAFALSDRGFKIVEVGVDRVKCPYKFGNKIKVRGRDVALLFGINLKESEVKSLMLKARYGADGSVPDYRLDILHKDDAVEDVGIMYGYDNIGVEEIKSYTTGETSEIKHFVNKVRDLIVGFGYQEAMNPMLTNKKTLFLDMEIEEFGVVEIKEYMSEKYSVVRNWLIPILMEFLSKNKHYEYPQKVFEQGLVSVVNGENAVDYERVAAAYCGADAGFTSAKQVLDAVLCSLGVKCAIRDVEHGSFIDGRVGRISVSGKDVGYIGEISPDVLSNFGLEFPVSCFELNLTELFEIRN